MVALLPIVGDAVAVDRALRSAGRPGCIEKAIRSPYTGIASIMDAVGRSLALA